MKFKEGERVKVRGPLFGDCVRYGSIYSIAYAEGYTTASAYTINAALYCQKQYKKETIAMVMVGTEWYYGGINKEISGVEILLGSNTDSDSSYDTVDRKYSNGKDGETNGPSGLLWL